MKMEKLILISFMKVGKEVVVEEEDEIKEKVKVGKTNIKLLLKMLFLKVQKEGEVVIFGIVGEYTCPILGTVFRA